MPKYNKVLIITTRPGGTKPVPLNYIAEASFVVGDKVMCETSKDWRPGYISRIVTTDVYHLDCHKKVIAADKYDKEKDGNKMKKVSSELFGLVLVESAKGSLCVCKSAYKINEGIVVAYEGTDNNLHVGTVVNSVGPGEIMEVIQSARVSDGFVADTIDTDRLDVCKVKENKYTALKAKLALRKKRFEEDAIWQMLAEKDEEAARLLEEMKGLKGDK